MTQRRPLAFAALALIAVALTGCGQSSERARPSPKPTPLFATDADALAAATKAYAAYLKVTEQVMKDGGKDADRVRAVASGTQLEAELEGFRAAEDQHLTGVGSVSFSGVTAVRSVGSRKMIGTLCENNAEMVILDQSGASLVSPERRPSTLYDVSFHVLRGQPARLIVSDRVPVSEQPC